MQIKTTGLAFLTGLVLAAPASAQPAAPPPGPPAAILAAAKLATVSDAPRYFKVVSVALGPNAKSSVSGPDGILYQVSGSTTVSLNGESKTLNAGEALFIPQGAAAVLEAGGAPSSLFHFFLARAADLDKPAETAPAQVKELYRTPGPIPALKAGAYVINLQRAGFAPQMAITPPHHRSGAAVYYIVSGTAMNTSNGRTVARAAGDFVYEPYNLVHQWANPSNDVVTRLVFNINPDGTPPVVTTPP